MQYTIRNIPRKVDKALRAKAKAEGKSLNQAAVDALQQALGVDGEAPKKYHDLDWFIGSGGLEKEVLDAIAEHDKVHPDDWK